MPIVERPLNVRAAVSGRSASGQFQSTGHRVGSRCFTRDLTRRKVDPVLRARA